MKTAKLVISLLLVSHALLAQVVVTNSQVQAVKDIAVAAQNAPPVSLTPGPGLALANGVLSITAAPGSSPLDQTPLANLPALPARSDIPTGVAAPGDNFVLTATGVAAANAPVLAEWTHEAGPDETINFTGYNTANSTFSVYAGSGSLKKGTVSALTSDAGQVRMPADFSYGTYVMWPSNMNGYGPAVLINNTRASWMRDIVVKGMTVSLYGKNLAKNRVKGTTNAYIYVKPTSGTGQFATVTKVSKYELQFTMPDVPNGEYQVWAHNGTGGVHGWSRPLSCTVVGAQDHIVTHVFSNTVNVMNYGAVPNDSTYDNSTAINSAANAAGADGTVFFPLGVYFVKNALGVHNNIAYLGEKTASGGPGGRIAVRRDFVRADFGLWGYYDRQVMTRWENIYFDNSRGVVVKTNVDTTNNNGYVAPLLVTPSFYMAQFKNCVFDTKNTGSLNFSGNNTSNIYIEQSEFWGPQVFASEPKQIHILKCKFRARYDAPQALQFTSPVRFSLVGCTYEDYNNSTNNIAGWGKGRLLAQQNEGSAGYNSYIADNVINNSGYRAGADDSNVGENFMIEGNKAQYGSAVLSATSNTITFSAGPNDYRQAAAQRAVAVIVKGKGIGQYGLVVANNTTTNTITLDRNWNVAPDATSLMVIGDFATNMVITDNTSINTLKDYIWQGTYHNASCVTNYFGGCVGTVFDGNFGQGLRYGLQLFNTQHAPSLLDPLYFVFVANNTFKNCRTGIAIHANSGNDGYDNLTLPGVGVLGLAIRNTIVTGTYLNYDIEYHLPRVNAFALPTLYNIVFEKNPTLREFPRLNHTGELFGETVLPIIPGVLTNEVFNRNNTY